MTLTAPRPPVSPTGSDAAVTRTGVRRSYPVRTRLNWLTGGRIPTETYEAVRGGRRAPDPGGARVPARPGGRHVDPELAADAITAGDSPLTAREADVLIAAEGGSPVEDIAATVSLSPGTVRNYLSSAMGKLHATTRHEAARLAREPGWL